MTPVQAYVALFGVAQPSTPLTAAEADLIKAGVDHVALRTTDQQAADRLEEFERDRGAFITKNTSDTRRPIWEWIDDLSADPSAMFPAPVSAPAAGPVVSTVGPVASPPVPVRGPGIALPAPAGPAGGGGLAPVTPPATPPVAAPTPLTPPAGAPPLVAPTAAPAGSAGSPAPLVAGGPPALPPRTGGGLGIMLPAPIGGSPATAPTPTPTRGPGVRTTPVAPSTPGASTQQIGGFQPWVERSKGFDPEYVRMIQTNSLVPGFRTALITSFTKVRDTNPRVQAAGRREVEGFRAMATNFRNGGGTSAEMSELFGRFLLQLIGALDQRLDVSNPTEFTSRFETGVYTP